MFHSGLCFQPWLVMSLCSNCHPLPKDAPRSPNWKYMYKYQRTEHVCLYNRLRFNYKKTNKHFYWTRKMVGHIWGIDLHNDINNIALHVIISNDCLQSRYYMFENVLLKDKNSKKVDRTLENEGWWERNHVPPLDECRTCFRERKRDKWNFWEREWEHR